MLKYSEKILINYGKKFSFLFLCWAVLGTAAGFAQTKQSPKRQSIVEASAKSAPPETENQTVSKDFAVEKSDKAPLTVRTTVSRQEPSVDQESDAGKEKAESSAQSEPPATDSFKYKFLMSGDREKPTVNNIALTMTRDEQFNSRRSFLAAFGNSGDSAPPDDPAPAKDENFHWRAAIGQSLMFLAIQHGYAVTQPKTREALKGKFWKDYVDSVKSLRGWDDGGRFFTNYIAHPMQGSFTGFIYVQNDPKALKQQFGASGDYWRSRLKAMAWSAAWSTQFEIGPVSQASIGNVGLKGKQTWGDVVVTPTVGTALLVTEDAIDRFVMQRIERATDNFYARIFARMLLSPTRTIANLFRFKTPWYRDRPLGH